MSMQEIKQAIQSSQSNFNAWGRARFMNNYAEGGIASYMFPAEGQKVRRGLFGMKAAPGSRAYNQNLQAEINRGGSGMEKAKELMTKNKGKGGLGFRAGRMIKGGLLGAAFIAIPAMMTEGGGGEKVKAMMGGAAAYGGWMVGAKVGAMAGAAIGSYIPVVGTAIGALAGAIVGGFAASSLGQTIGEATYGLLDSIAARGRRRRTSNWIGDMSAFRTQKAATMRQASLQMMNNGLMTARSAMGNEGIMFHQ